MNNINSRDTLLTITKIGCHDLGTIQRAAKVYKKHGIIKDDHIDQQTIDRLVERGKVEVCYRVPVPVAAQIRRRNPEVILDVYA